MILKKLEISGFKSFGKKVELEFDAPITAIVGPNGSGKSNVSEAIRWVLGEQSLKSLRGKRGEDLIFHGSNSASQLGKARVAISFDNTSQIFPLDFSEVTVSREVYRDGANEYRLNDSQVRLKDIIELMSNVGIGGSGHHIISQGEADRILYASARERKTMIEDALGLRIYHSKQAETERKLAATEENMREVGMLRREIQPHMRFLREQAKKVEASEKLRQELIVALHDYFSREEAVLKAHEAALQERARPLKETHAAANQEVEILRANVTHRQDETMRGLPAEWSALSRRLEEIDMERRSLERDIGRMEGQLAVLSRPAVKGESGQATSISSEEIGREYTSILSLVEQALDSDSLDSVRKVLARLKTQIESFLSRLTGGPSASASHTGDEQANVAKERDHKLQRVRELEEERRQQLAVKGAMEERQQSSHASLTADQNTLRQKQEALFQVRDALRTLEVEWEHIRMRQEEFAREREEARVYGDIVHLETGRPSVSWQGNERDTARNAIQRLKIKLEEAGGINPEVVREFKEVEERDSFLAKELDDLQKTEVSLRNLMQELEEELGRNFSEGLKKINGEFNTLFESMFGGGSATLMLIKLPSKESEDNVEVKLPSKEELGVDITVDIPRKRVKNLDMLSGGERALTSIALLFAMSFVNPPPFLVLDETDAALDEANSQRYAAMLTNLSGKTQLIVITHNRATMKEAGVLYGVTMGSDGISRLLSLQFGEAAQVSESVKH